MRIIDMTIDLEPNDQRNKIENWIHEEGMVLPSGQGTPFYHCADPSDAEWLAERLNEMAKFEREARAYMAEYVKGAPLHMPIKQNGEVK